MIDNYVPLEQVLERLNRIKIPGEKLNPEEAREWTYQALEKIGSTAQYIEDRITIDVTDSKALLPLNLHTIIEIYESKSDKVLIPLTEVDYRIDLKEFNYKVTNGYIYIYNDTTTTTPVTKLVLYYFKFPTTETGGPLIPDNEMFIAAIEHYLRFMMGYRAFWNKNIVFNELNMLEQRWLFYCMAARNQTKVASMDLRSIKGAIYRNFPSLNRGNIKL